ncbi:MAG: aminotransferase class V-fold PLP-dependent enzyme [Planctomycetes bacterium]|nr:aminotransferase class V-fold PLP-dependent enzyme [Planctomycetota bacterium]
MDLRAQILQRELEASSLEPPAAERERLRGAVVNYTEEFLGRIREAKAFSDPEADAADILKLTIDGAPRPIADVLRAIGAYIDGPGLNPASGGHLGYIPGGGIYISALGDYLADITNRFAGIFYAGPGAVRIENQLIRWMADLLGMPAEAAGNLTSGGSLANLIGIVTARDAKNVRARDVESSAIYCTSQAHHSVDKAIRIAGLRECKIRNIELDDRYRMRADALERAIAEDKENGVLPFVIIASAGTTDVGAVDPLEAISRIARRHDCWFHVDAAYGGFFILTKEGKTKLRGIELADSVAIDPHKGLFLPYGLGVAIVRDRKHLHAAHYYLANYMQDARGATGEASPAELSPELTKHFRGMRLWLPLQLLGVAPFRACLEEKLLLAKYFYRRIREIGFETRVEPELSVVTYRYIPKNGDANEFNQRLIREIVKDGRVFISSTMLDGKFTLRFACLAFRTHLETVDLLLSMLEEKVNSIAAGK